MQTVLFILVSAGAIYAILIVLFALYAGFLVVMDTRDRGRGQRDRVNHPGQRAWSQLAALEAQLADIDVAAIIAEHQQSKEQS